MALSVTTANSVTVQDSAQNINIQQSKTVINAAADINFSISNYTLDGSMANYIALDKTDISQLQDISIYVTEKPGTYAGVGVGFGSSEPASDSFVLKDTFVLNGEIDDKVWIKNTNVDEVKIMIVFAGTNA